MGIVIKSAMFGDDTSAQDVTKTVANATTVTANSSLLPVLETTKSVSLTDEEEAKIKEDATAACGGNANDNACIQHQTDEFRRTKLQSKIAERNSTANTVVGRRLTVVAVDERGLEHEYVIPEGQTFTVPGKSSTPSLSFKAPTLGGTALSFLTLFGTTAMLFLWVFSVVATYRTFRQGGYVMGAYAATAAAVLFPYSGFAIMLAFFAVQAYRKNSMLQQ